MACRKVNRFSLVVRSLSPLGMLGIGLTLTAASCERPERTPMERGARIFVRTCSACHGVDGSARNAVGMNPPPRDLSNPVFHQQTTPEQLRQVIRLGKGQMPAFGGLMADTDIDAVVGFLPTLARANAATTP